MTKAAAVPVVAIASVLSSPTNIGGSSSARSHEVLMVDGMTSAYRLSEKPRVTLMYPSPNAGNKQPPARPFSGVGGCSMEPGGFEPPCRNGDEAASTCVVTLLFSCFGAAGDVQPKHMAYKFLVPPKYASPLEPARCLSTGRLIRHQATSGRGLGRECVLRVGSYGFASFLRGRDAPRHATTTTIRPIDAVRPLMSKSAGVIQRPAVRPWYSWLPRASTSLGI